MLIKFGQIYLLVLTLLLAGCSSRTMNQMAEGMAVTFAALICFFILFWICVTIHKSLSEKNQKKWETICGVGLILIIVILALLSDGSGDMENVWRARRK